MCVDSPLRSGSSLFSRMSRASVPSSIRSSLVITPIVRRPKEKCVTGNTDVLIFTHGWGRGFRVYTDSLMKQFSWFNLNKWRDACEARNLCSTQLSLILHHAHHPNLEMLCKLQIFPVSPLACQFLWCPSAVLLPVVSAPPPPRHPPAGLGGGILPVICM